MSTAQDLPTMPLLDHLRELRRRLIYSFAALLVGMLVSLPAAIPVIDGLKSMCTVCRPQALSPTEGIVTYFRAALALGMALVLPVILYQAVAFVRPALYPKEKRYLYLLLPGSAALFCLGLAFGYFVVLPRTINFLAAFPQPWAEPNWSIGLYIAFVTNLLVMVGVAFQTPLAVYVLSKLGVLSPSLMAKYRRHAILLLAVLAAALTPTPDPFTMILVLLPMLLMYEFGMILARFA